MGGAWSTTGHCSNRRCRLHLRWRSGEPDRPVTQGIGPLRTGIFNIADFVLALGVGIIVLSRARSS